MRRRRERARKTPQVPGPPDRASTAILVTHWPCGKEMGPACPSQVCGWRVDRTAHSIRTSSGMIPFDLPVPLRRKCQLALDPEERGRRLWECPLREGRQGLPCLVRCPAWAGVGSILPFQSGVALTAQ